MVLKYIGKIYLKILNSAFLKQLVMIPPVTSNQGWIIGMYKCQKVQMFFLAISDSSSDIENDIEEPSKVSYHLNYI